tara:strand:+ start:240 stop:422 length:183 start_codon:yes stop_codon:yes gene_type:complete
VESEDDARFSDVVLVVMGKGPTLRPTKWQSYRRKLLDGLTAALALDSISEAKLSNSLKAL